MNELTEEEIDSIVNRITAKTKNETKTYRISRIIRIGKSLENVVVWTRERKTKFDLINREIKFHNSVIAILKQENVRMEIKENFLNIGFLTDNQTSEEQIERITNSGEHKVFKVVVKAKGLFGNITDTERYLFIPKAWLERYPGFDDHISNLYDSSYIKQMEEEFNSEFKCEDLRAYLGHWKVTE